MGTPDLDVLPPDLSAHVGYLLVRAGKHAQRLFSAQIATLGLRPALADVVILLRARGSLSQVEIATTLAIERAHLVALLDQLEALGFVLRSADPADRRRHAVTLTEAGTTAAERLGGMAEAVEGLLLADLSDEEREQFRSLLQRMARRAEEGA